jgi:hypothetical protein
MRVGSRGDKASARFALRRLDARDLNMEMIAHPEITILTSEKSGTVKNSPVMVQMVVMAAERAGIPYRLTAAMVGEANDAGSFSLASLKATTLIPFRPERDALACVRDESLPSQPRTNKSFLSIGSIFEER